VHARTDKQDAIELIEQLPDDPPMDEIVYRLRLLNNIRRGMQDVDAGRGVLSDGRAREVEHW
jgi:hypothetical protein